MRKFRTSVEGGDRADQAPDPTGGTSWVRAMGRCVNCHLLDKDLVLARKSYNTPASSARSSVFLIHRHALFGQVG